MDKQHSFKTGDEVDEEINDIMGVVSGGAVVKTHASVEDIDINQFRWTKMEARLSDRIGSTTMAISQPSERGWHSLTQLGGKCIVAFGGLKYRFGEKLSSSAIDPHCNYTGEIKYPNRLKHHRERTMWNIWETLSY